MSAREGRLLYCGGEPCSGWTHHEKVETPEGEEFACSKCGAARLVPGAIRRDFQTAETVLDLGRLGYLQKEAAQEAHAALLSDLARYGYTSITLRRPMTDAEALLRFQEVGP